MIRDPDRSERTPLLLGTCQQKHGEEGGEGDLLASSGILELDELRLAERFLGHGVIWCGLGDLGFRSITC